MLNLSFQLTYSLLTCCQLVQVISSVPNAPTTGPNNPAAVTTIPTAGPSDPTAAQSGPSTAHAPTYAELLNKQARIECRLLRAKGAIAKLRQEMDEVRRINEEQNARIIKIGVYMDHIGNNYLDPSSI